MQNRPSEDELARYVKEMLKTFKKHWPTSDGSDSAFQNLIQACVNEFWYVIQFTPSHMQIINGAETEYAWDLKPLSPLQAPDIIKKKVVPWLREAASKIAMNAPYFTEFEELYNSVEDEFGDGRKLLLISAPAAPQPSNPSSPATQAAPTDASEDQKLQETVSGLGSAVAGFYRKHANYDEKFSQLELQLAECIQEIYTLKEYVSSQTGYKAVIQDYQTKSSQIDSLIQKSSQIDSLIQKSSQIDSLIQKTSKIDELIQEKEAKANNGGIISYLFSRTTPTDIKKKKAHMSALLQQMKDLNSDHQH
jgi:hypothetical protein